MLPVGQADVSGEVRTGPGHDVGDVGDVGQRFGTPLVAAPRAIRAAPVRSGCSAGSSWLIPSGKIATMPPRASRRFDTEKVAEFRVMVAPSAAR